MTQGVWDSGTMRSFVEQVQDSADLETDEQQVRAVLKTVHEWARR